jgi:catechol 2,3-dioxygenase-like lactoylglutathione lyase family enzyme
MFIEHVNLTVTDVRRSADFYERLFGWHARWEGTTNDGRPAAHVGDDRCYLALFQSSKDGRAPMDYDTVGVNHFGVVVENLDEMRARLDALGAEYGDEQDYEPGRRLYLIDPDGIEVELVQYETATV